MAVKGSLETVFYNATQLPESARLVVLLTELQGRGGVLEGFGLVNKIHYSLFRSLIKKEIKSYTVTLLEKMFKNHSNATWIIIAKKESESNCL